MQARLKSLLPNLALACVSVCLGLLAIEFGYRVQAGLPVFTLENWRAGRIEYLGFGDRGMADPVLGWRPKEWYHDEGYDSLDHGIRRNFQEDKLRTGEILAVGDSFTNFNELRNEETWPAHLERMIGRPVLNAGVSGYATDQIVLRAEQLLPIVKPKLLIVGFLEHDISRAQYSSFGAPKPYFTLANGTLTYHPPKPATRYDLGTHAWQTATREFLGHSAVLDTVLSRLAPNYWNGKAGQQVLEKAGNDPVAVTCALLQRLKTRVDNEGVTMLLFLQHGWNMIAERNEPSSDAKQVTACAQAADIQVVDQFQSLRAIFVGSRDALRALYLNEGDNYGFGHMSSKGNEHAAGLLAAALKK